MQYSYSEGDKVHFVTWKVIKIHILSPILTKLYLESEDDKTTCQNSQNTLYSGTSCAHLFLGDAFQINSFIKVRCVHKTNLQKCLIFTQESYFFSGLSLSRFELIIVLACLKQSGVKFMKLSKYF